MMRTIKYLLLTGLVLGVGWYFWNSRAVSLGPGVMAPHEPVQEELHRPPMIRQGDFSIMPLASFRIQAKVLSKKRYRWDAPSSISPVDLALGWGRMSDEKVLEAIDIRQSGRWYRWMTKKPPIPMKEIKVCSANMHMIPATDEVRKTLLSVRKGQIISIEGSLVRVIGENGWKWTSSLSRKDSGDGACEIVYVEKLTIIKGG